jgi:hypothetical protein
MAVRIRETPFTNSKGTFTLHPDGVRADLMIIADLDGSFGDAPDPGEAGFSVIQFAPGPLDTTTAAGRVKDQLKTLVDRGSVLDILGVGADFLHPDGTTIETSPGATSGTTQILYDTSNCDGDGRWIVGTNGDHECTPSAGILHHEMGHALLSAADPLHPESEAIGQENDLRERLGLVPRDPNDQQSGCGCPDSGCCIIASVATGSAFSTEVHALRRVRDHVLRGTRMGERLFEELFDEYYRFSTRVCRILVCHPEARENVERWLVRPLVRALGLATDYTGDPAGVERLGAQVLADAISAAFLPRGPEGWRQALAFLDSIEGKAAAGRAGSNPTPPLDAATAEVVAILCQHLPHCPHVAWGIVEPIWLYAALRLWIEQCGDDPPSPAAVGAALRLGFDDWLARVPLDAWEGIPADTMASDLERLAGSVFTSAGAQERLMRRLAAFDRQPSFAGA